MLLEHSAIPIALLSSGYEHRSPHATAPLSKTVSEGKNRQEIKIMKINMSKAEQMGNQQIRETGFESRQSGAEPQVVNAWKLSS